MNKQRKKVNVPMNKKADSLNLVDYSDMKIPMAVVYNKPLDFPDKVIVRVFEGATNQPTNVYCEYDTIEECRRDAYAAGFVTRFDRSQSDDIHIVESYMR